MGLSSVIRFGSVLTKICKPQVHTLYRSVPSAANISTTSVKCDNEVSITFVLDSGERKTVKAKIGDTLMDTVVNNDLDIDGFGACGGTLTCSTCHLIFKKPDHDKIPNAPVSEELDMLELANGRTMTSRLGCQIIVSKDLDKIEIDVPACISDARDN